MMTHAVRALAEQHPQFRIGVHTTAMDLWAHNPHIDRSINDQTSGVQVIDCHYDTINESNQRPHQFIDGYRVDLENRLNVRIKPIPFYESVFLSDQERSSVPITAHPYWIINAGFKSDYTAKQWPFDRWQSVVDRLSHVTFVQVGSNDHIHPVLSGQNIIDMVGRTTIRDMVVLTHHAFGVVTGVSFPQVLATAVPPHPRWRRQSRALVLVAGGREPSHWQFPPNAQFLHTCGMLDCCSAGGCWKSRVVPLPDGDDKNNSLCVLPVIQESGQVVARCMDMISVDDVVRAIARYMDNLNPSKSIQN